MSKEKQMRKTNNILLFILITISNITMTFSYELTSDKFPQDLLSASLYRNEIINITLSKHEIVSIFEKVI